MEPLTTMANEVASAPAALSADYLVVGAGAMGMAFTDELLRWDRRARVVLVDRRRAPGGHWHDAYDFVRLHQPAAFYGVSSLPLGRGGEDLASKHEILAYYERALEHLLDSGRVTWLGQCEANLDGAVRSLVDPDRRWHVRARKVVNATFSEVRVPSNTPPTYDVHPDASVVPINALAHLDRPRARYVIVGAGKTGMDALLFLLDSGVPPDKLTWVVNRTSWLLDRQYIQPRNAILAVPHQLKAMRGARDAEDLLERLERHGWWHRLDAKERPTMFRCATVSLPEAAALRTIEDVVRMGRVRRVEPGRLVFDGGEHRLAPDTLVVDCTADGLARRPTVPVFDGPRITLQPVVMCQQVYSSAVIAMIETRLGGANADAEKNAMAQPVPHPETPADYFACMRTAISNASRWVRRPWMLWRLSRCRLDIGHHVRPWVGVWAIIGLLRWGRAGYRSFCDVADALDDEAGPETR